MTNLHTVKLQSPYGSFHAGFVMSAIGDYRVREAGHTRRQLRSLSTERAAWLRRVLMCAVSGCARAHVCEASSGFCGQLGDLTSIRLIL